MRNWLNETPSTDKDMIEIEERFRIRGTIAYYELEFRLAEVGYLTTYILPRTETSVMVASNWEDAFGTDVSDLAPMLTDEVLLTEAAKAWPTFIRLLINGITDKYSEGALVRLEDRDNGDTKWFVVTVLGNIDPNDIETILSERGFEALDLVTSVNFDLVTEFQNNKPDNFQVFKRMFFKGVKEGVLEAVKAFLFMPGSGSSNEIPTSLNKPPTFKYFEDLQRRGG